MYNEIVLFGFDVCPNPLVEEQTKTLDAYYKYE